MPKPLPPKNQCTSRFAPALNTLSDTRHSMYVYRRMDGWRDRVCEWWADIYHSRKSRNHRRSWEVTYSFGPAGFWVLEDHWHHLFLTNGTLDPTVHSFRKPLCACFFHCSTQNPTPTVPTSNYYPPTQQPATNSLCFLAAAILTLSLSLSWSASAPRLNTEFLPSLYVCVYLTLSPTLTHGRLELMTKKHYL